MPHDARLGMVLGVSAVILFAVLFFRKDVPALTGNVQSPSSTSALITPIPPVPGLPSVIPANRKHTVQEGETLVSIAAKYYGDGRLASFLFRANRDRLMAPDRVPLGTILYIPEKPADLAKR
jgi:nucleoid-associated protein YgaU